MRDISEIEDERVLRDLLKAEPNSLVEQKQRLRIPPLVLEYTNSTHHVLFGTVVCFEESMRTWTVLYDSGSAIPFYENDIVEALQLYKKEKDKDTGPYLITNPCNLFAMGKVSSDYKTLNKSENMMDHEYLYQASDGSFEPTYNVNADFDAYISANYKPGVDEFTFTDIMAFWDVYSCEDMDEPEVKMVFQHSLQSIWANIDVVTKKPLKEECVPLIKAHICNCIITRDHTRLARILNSEDRTNYAHKEANAATATEEAMVDYLKTVLESYHYRDEAISIIESDTISIEVLRQVTISTLNGYTHPSVVKVANDIANCSDDELKRRVLQVVNLSISISGKIAKALVMNRNKAALHNERLNTLKDSVNEAYEGINLKTTQEDSGSTHLSICFEDTLSQCKTEVYRIDIDQPLKEVFQLYSQRNHIPVEKLQFMYLSKRLTCDTLETLRALRVMNNTVDISVFRMFDRISENPDQMRFIKLPECTYYVEEGSEGDEESIFFMDTVTYKRVQFNGRDAQIKMNKILKAYAKHVGAPVTDLLFSRYNKVIFMSSIRNLTWEEFFAQDDNDNVTPIIVTPKVEKRQEKQERVPLANSTNIRTKKAKKKKHKKSNKKRAQPLVIQLTEVELKVKHSKLLGKVYEEAEPTFKEIRQKLNALNLERTKPKQKKTQSTTTKPVEVLGDNALHDSQLGGKAGKTQFIIQVGEVSNLYKTTKPSSAGCGRRQDDIMIDLHGLTAEEAVYRLDKHLPDWIEIAMKGSYPFVIPVKIVCGGGSQILAEVVENWIKQNDNVANAPKNMYS